MQSLCYYCMTPTMAGNTCTVCGRPPAPFSKKTDAGVLPPGTELDNGSVIVGAKIGRGGFGITYRALDKQRINRRYSAVAVEIGICKLLVRQRFYIQYIS